MVGKIDNVTGHATLLDAMEQAMSTMSNRMTTLEQWCMKNMNLDLQCTIFVLIKHQAQMRLGLLWSIPELQHLLLQRLCAPNYLAQIMATSGTWRGIRGAAHPRE